MQHMAITLKLRLVHKIFLLLAGTTAVTVLAVSLLIAQMLAAGFGRFVQRLDEDRLEALARLAQVRHEREGDFDSMVLAWRGIFELSQQAEDISARLPNLAIVRQVLIFDADGRVLAGTPPAAGHGELLQRDVLVGGHKVGAVGIVRLPTDPAQVFPDIVHRQRLAIAGSALATLVVALLASAWLARRLARRLLNVADSASRLADADLDARVFDNGSDEVSLLAAQLNEMASRLGAAEQSRRQWLAHMAHELRNPLAVMGAEIEAMQDGIRRLDVSALASLREEVSHLTRLANDLHLLALAEMGELPLYPENLDVAAVAKRAVTRWSGAASRAGLSLELQPASAVVRADEGRLLQILDNLLSNAVRYTDAPGRIRLTFRSFSDAVVLSVDDSAPGLSATQIDRLFQPLFRADAARSRAAGGSGLGLALVKAIARSHGWTVQALASPMGGIRVEIRLPRPAGDTAP